MQFYHDYSLLQLMYTNKSVMYTSMIASGTTYANMHCITRIVAQLQIEIGGSY